MKKTLFDPQVNGGPGVTERFVDFSVPGLTSDLVLEASHRWHEMGSGLYLPTVITTSPAGYQNLAAIAAAMDHTHGQSILGIHVEGPFLNRIAKGAHPEQFMVAPTIEGFQRLQDLANGRIVLMTVAPELDGGLDLIEFLAESGVAVSIGHSQLVLPQFQDAVEAGATLVTHVTNGLPSTVDRAKLKEVWRLLVIRNLLDLFREQGILDPKITDVIALAGADIAVVDLIHAYLTDPRVTPMVITDGCHVTDFFIQVAVALRGLDNLIITSDAAPLAHAEPGHYSVFNGLSVEVIWPDPGQGFGRPELKPLCGSYWSELECVNILGATVESMTEQQAFAVGRDNALRRLAGPLNRIGIDPAKRLLPRGRDLYWNGAEAMFEITA